MGALSDYVEKRFGVKTRSVVNPTVANGIIPAGVTQVLHNNPDRLMVTLINLDAAAMRLAPHGAPAAGVGIWLDANGGFVSLTAEEDGELVGFPWWVWSLAGAVVANFFVIETEAQ